ncbi:MAG: hypothetical protein WC592_01405 [Candidatus Omnitrophota bacterium]
MKILAVSGDVGGARAVMPVLKKLFDEKTPFVISDNGFLGKEAPAEWPRAVLPDWSDRDSVKGLIEKEGVTLVIFTTSVKDAVPLGVARAARNAGLPVICILDNWMTYRKRMEVDGLETFLPDVYAMMDELAFEEAVADGLPPSILKVTGQPALASIAESYRSMRREDYADKLRSCGIMKDKQLIVFISEPAEKDQGAGPSSTNFRGYTEKTVLRQLCACLQPYSGRIQIGIAPHPREDQEELSRSWEAYRGGLTGGILKNTSGRESVFLADGVAGMASILLYEAYLVGKPSISLQPGLRLPQLAFMKKKKGCRFLDDPGSWKEYVDGWIADVRKAPGAHKIDPELEFHLKASDRIIRTIKDSMKLIKKKGA